MVVFAIANIICAAVWKTNRHRYLSEIACQWQALHVWSLTGHPCNLLWQNMLTKALQMSLKAFMFALGSTSSTLFPSNTFALMKCSTQWVQLHVKLNCVLTGRMYTGLRSIHRILISQGYYYNFIHLQLIACKNGLQTPHSDSLCSKMHLLRSLSHTYWASALQTYKALCIVSWYKHTYLHSYL